MAQTKKVSLKDALARQKTPPPSQEELSRSWPPIDPPEEILAKETEEILQKYEQEDSQDPDVKAAEEIKKQIQEEKTKEKPTRTRTPAKVVVKNKKWEKNCKRCGVVFKPADRRSVNCLSCWDILKRENAGKKPLDREKTEEKLRPFLRLGFNLKESCLEAEIGYSTIKEKLKTWEWFADFVERHQNYSILKAKRNIFAINGDLTKHGAVEVGKNSRWLLERRRPDEYGPKVTFDTNPGGSSLDPEKEKIMQQLLASRNLWQQQLDDTTTAEE